MGAVNFVPLELALDALCSACGVDDTNKERCEYRKECNEYNRILKSAFLNAEPSAKDTEMR